MRPSSADDVVLFEKRDHIAFITLNRPDSANALTREMASILEDIWQEVKQDASIRCVVITGAGTRHFSAGKDLNDPGEADSPPHRDGPLRAEVRWSARQNEVWKPTIGAVNGLVTGGGLHFVVDSDIIVASENAVFMESHVDVGFVGALEPIGLANRLPLGTALRMTLQGRKFRLSAQRAYQLGLVDELTSPDDLMSTAEQIASDIAENSPRAASLSLQAVWSRTEMAYSQALEYGWTLVRMHRQHPDFEEGPRAFAERRPPQWEDGVEQQ